MHKSKEREVNAIINREMFDVTGFDNRQDIDIFDYQHYSNNNTNRAVSELDTYDNRESIPKEV